MGVGVAGSLAHAGEIKSMNAGKSGIAKYWTKERRVNAVPRDLVIDQRGLGYLRKSDGSFAPYGHQIEAKTPQPLGKPINESNPPEISEMNPAEGVSIGDSYTFSAMVTDQNRIKSVTFVIYYPDGISSQSFSPLNTGNDIWRISLQGFYTGDWAWAVEAEDSVKNTGTSDTVNFTVGTGPEPPPGDDSDTTPNAIWDRDNGGAVQTAAGRIYFEMPTAKNPRKPWQGYVCSGTVVSDDTSGRSVILTAAHCVYDDANKAFARNVLFIPDQAGTDSDEGTDRDGSNDPLGSWAPSFGVVDENWTSTTFPDNIEWDYAFYVVNDTDTTAHTPGLTPNTSDILDVAAATLQVSFSTPYYDDGTSGADTDDFTYALGYSFDWDPNLMYCAEDMTKEGEVNWWLPSSELSGGSSGGPWVQPMDTDTGSGPVISVNSWSYINLPGMAGPMLDITSAECVFNTAILTEFVDVANDDGKAGVTYNGDCP
nr:hypothetical protein [uncultured Desulfobacter sp.]